MVGPQAKARCVPALGHRLIEKLEHRCDLIGISQPGMSPSTARLHAQGSITSHDCSSQLLQVCQPLSQPGCSAAVQQEPARRTVIEWLLPLVSMHSLRTSCFINPDAA
jgi:hypothetical protein